MGSAESVPQDGHYKGWMHGEGVERTPGKPEE